MTTTALPGVWLDVPADFHELPLDVAIEDRAAAQTTLLDELGLVDSAQREGLGLYFEALARNLRGGPVVGTAFCAVELDGHPSTATLTVAVQSTHVADPLVGALGMAEVLRREGAYDRVAVERVGHHVAVVGVGTLQFQPDAELRQITFAVPVAGHPMTVLITVATASADDFATYDRLARDVTASLRLL